MATLNLETNVEELDIVRNGENIGKIYIDLADVGLLTRLRKAADKSSAEYEALQERSGSLSAEEMLDEMERVDAFLRDTIDEAMGAKVSDVVFGELFCYTSKNGVTLLEQFINGILDMFDARVKEESAKVEKHIGKYAAKK